MNLSPLVGRHSEYSQLTKTFENTAAGQGQIILLAGEAGMGKTRLANHAVENANIFTLSAAANETATPPYGPFIDIFRTYLRNYPDGLNEIGPLKPYLAQLLPEISDSLERDNQNTLIEAIRVALETIANKKPTILFLDDLHWADNTTLELLPKLAEWLTDYPLLILGAYRSDEIPRGHPVRRIKNDLRRTNHLNEIIINPLTQTETQQLAEQLLQSAITPALSQALYLKTQGVPFFIEELIATMKENNHLRFEGDIVDLVSDENIPLPDTVRDAILIRFDKLSPQTKEYLEVAAVVGQQFSFELLANLIEYESIEEATQNGFLIKSSSELGQFRHALTREAIYNEINWTRAKDLHRKIASHFEKTKTSPNIIAEHWHAGKELHHARKAYIKAVDNSCAIHAYADAAHAAKRAIDLWPEGEDEMERLALLDQLGQCAQISGSLNDATRAWREAAESYRSINASQEFAEVQRKLATVYGLQGTWEKAMTASKQAAEAFLNANNKLEATKELIGLVGHLHTSGKYNQATPFAEQALTLAEEINDTNQKARALGLLGSLKTRIGFPDEGLEMAQAGLSLALAENLFSAASELYQRLGAIMEHFGNYAEAQNTYTTGFNFCETHGISPYAHLCQACVSVIAFQTGDFKEVLYLNNAIISTNDAPPPVKVIAKTMLGLTQSFLGEINLARENLTYTLSIARKTEYMNLVLYSNWGLAISDWHENALDSAKNYCQSILSDWSLSDESHYSIPALRFAATFFSTIGDGEYTRASADSLAKIATTLSTYESLAGLAHALGEVACVNNQLPQAVEHFEKAIDLLTDKNLPLEEAETKYRAGLAHLAINQKEKGIALLTSAYQLMQPIGERFYSQKIIAVLDQNGVSLEKLLGKRKATKAKFGGLTRRQLEVLKLVAEGMTNQQIADTLFLSSRTVEMHVSNVLAVLDCRSRTEAVKKANALGILI